MNIYLHSILKEEYPIRAIKKHLLLLEGKDFH